MIHIHNHNKTAEQLEKEITNSKDTRTRVLLRNDLTEMLIFTDRKKAVQQNEICLKEAQEIKDQKLITLFKFKKNAGLVFK